MDEQQQLELVDDAFSAFRAGGALVHPVGADAARATVKHRRRVRIVTATALAAIAVMIPASAYATGFFGAKGPPVPGNSTAPTVAPTESTPPSAPAASMTPVAPDGRVTVADLSHATVNLGSQPREETLCGGIGAFTFNGNPTAGKNPQTGAERYSIEKVVDVDFDHDGALESVALIDCSIQGHDSVVVALDRDVTGKIVTVGQVVATKSSSPVRAVFDIRADPNGAIGVQVGDKGVCCATTEAMVEHEWRGYTYDGQRFTQTSGRTAFTPVAPGTDLGMTMSDLTLGTPTNGLRHGSVTATVTNHGPKPAPGAIIQMSISTDQGVPGSVKIETDLNDCTIRPLKQYDGKVLGTQVECHLFGFKAGESRSFTFRITSATANDGALQATRGGWLAGSIRPEQPGVRELTNDPNYSNDQPSSQIKLS